MREESRTSSVGILPLSLLLSVIEIDGKVLRQNRIEVMIAQKTHFNLRRFRKERLVSCPSAVGIAPLRLLASVINSVIRIKNQTSWI